MKIELNNYTGALILTPENDRELRITNSIPIASRGLGLYRSLIENDCNEVIVHLYFIGDEEDATS